jgi:RES domain-containing protein
MQSKSNPRFDALLKELRDQTDDLLRPWEGDCWRFQTISHPASRQILDGKGALTQGGRWNAPGAFPVVYGSTTGKVALEESEANDRYFGIVTRKARMYVCIGFKLSRVLDLTRSGTLDRLGLKARHLQAEDWRKIQAGGRESLTQCIGRAAFSAGAEGLLVRSSAVRKGINLAWFPNRKAAGSSVILHDSAAIDAMLQAGS